MRAGEKACRTGPGLRRVRRHWWKLGIIRCVGGRTKAIRTPTGIAGTHRAQTGPPMCHIGHPRRLRRSESPEPAIPEFRKSGVPDPARASLPPFKSMG
ncbi:hypothetical protein GCM10027081_59680 [Cupriavidus yeoncheonensis]